MSGAGEPGSPVGQLRKRHAEMGDQLLLVHGTMRDSLVPATQKNSHTTQNTRCLTRSNESYYIKHSWADKSVASVGYVSSGHARDGQLVCLLVSIFTHCDSALPDSDHHL